ncbi:hypothetical protein PGT21_003433 [Puccinia graminis f. sp. tritici]|uniref:Uncharacterized protein n=1 Tax=Puccinia graminis f. sp. tritici TaxID=56615 RepID=A0A5B0NJK2_PUCGR|nr:hypothetical protein PGTUg99_017981 [Puccinia graminis f. sp. tritici]KAA1105339.1 hypothetical protein PGT21_003433 [Puccinia graminis f. sp. tritici]KAA1124434.1 hypothetical protein PGTUg99_032491 [Puccinia graminis f. sp. tritici]
MSVLARPALWTEENHEFHVADCDEEKLSKMVAELQDVLDGGNTLKRPLENEHQNQQSTSMTAVDGKRESKTNPHYWIYLKLIVSFFFSRYWSIISPTSKKKAQERY